MRALYDCRDAFAGTLIELVREDPGNIAVANDSVSSSKLAGFRERFPTRLINVGIAEQTMVGVSAGLSNGGKIPFVCGASCFITARALEQIKVDLAYSNANVVFRSQLEVWQLPSTVYKLMAVSYAELRAKVSPRGPLGRYLVEQLVEWNSRWVSGPIEYRSLGDSPAVGVITYPDCGRWELRPAPEFSDDMYYHHTHQHRPIRVYESVDARFILEDFFAKLASFAQRQGHGPAS